MKHETVENVASRVENSRAYALLLCLLLFAFGCGMLEPAYGQSSSVLQANQVVAGGETRPPATSLQPSSALTVEAWVSTPTAVTNYPAFVSYGLATSPYESYVLQAQTCAANHSVRDGMMP